MLFTEDPLAMLIDRLRVLSKADQDGVLARLDAAERARVEAALDAAPVGDGSTVSRDLAERIASPASDRTMTPATRAVLTRVAGRASAAVPVVIDTLPAPSLFERLLGAMRRR